ncbi:MAG: hypothetical protein EB084_01665 [Proteobacteria bacterium]|nr:hypothetical protein [Pseudomonadota bacterium]
MVVLPEISLVADMVFDLLDVKASAGVEAGFATLAETGLLGEYSRLLLSVIRFCRAVLLRLRSFLTAVRSSRQEDHGVRRQRLPTLSVP